MKDNTPDHVAGTQLAFAVVINMLVAQQRGNPVFAAGLEAAFELARSTTLASLQNDRRLQAFDETAEAVLRIVNS
jgi:hypothetical protein